MSTLADISVPYRTEQGSYSLSGDSKSATASESYFMAFTDHQQFCLEVLGESVGVTTPVQCPYWSNQVATSVNAEPLGYHVTNVYKEARVTVQYKTADYETTGDDAFRSDKLRFSGNMLTLPGLAYKFADNTPVESGVGQVVPEIEFSVTWAKIATLPTSTILAAIGKVNSTLFLGANAGTVLFAGADSDNQTSMGGVSKKSVQYSFIFRPIEWNKFLNPVTGNFATITTATGAFVYQSYELNNLI